MRKHVFVSYSRKDIEFFKRITLSLKRKGIPLWTDTMLTPGTRQWKSAIEQAIENSAVVIALLSPDAKASEWVDRELEYARMHGIPVIPLLLRGDEVSSVPLELVTSQRIDLASSESYESGIQKLLQALALLGVKDRSIYHTLHEELVLLSNHVPDLRWIAIVSVDGLMVAFVPKSDYGEEDRISAMSAAQLSMGERITSELGVGSLLFSVLGGKDGMVLHIPLDDEHVLSFAVSRLGSLDSLFGLLRDALKPIMQILT